MDGTAVANGPSRLDRWLRNWSRLWDDVEAFNSLGPMDDFMTPGQRLGLARMLARRHPVELDRLLATLRVDPAAMGRRNPIRLQGMELACLSCRAWRRCRKAHRNGSLAREYQAFCPNAARIQTALRGLQAEPCASPPGG